MTVNTVVYVPEGIVLTADSRLTAMTSYPNGITEKYDLSDNLKKVILINSGTVGITYSGMKPL